MLPFNKKKKRTYTHQHQHRQSNTYYINTILGEKQTKIGIQKRELKVKIVKILCFVSFNTAVSNFYCIKYNIIGTHQKRRMKCTEKKEKNQHKVKKETLSVYVGNRLFVFSSSSIVPSCFSILRFFLLFTWLKWKLRWSKCSN